MTLFARIQCIKYCKQESLANTPLFFLQFDPGSRALRLAGRVSPLQRVRVLVTEKQRTASRVYTISLERAFAPPSFFLIKPASTEHRPTTPHGRVVGFFVTVNTSSAPEFRFGQPQPSLCQLHTGALAVSRAAAAPRTPGRPQCVRLASQSQPPGAPSRTRPAPTPLHRCGPARGRHTGQPRGTGSGCRASRGCLVRAPPSPPAGRAPAPCVSV